MKNFRKNAAAWIGIALSLCMTARGTNGPLVTITTKSTPTVTVTPSSSSITTAQVLSVSVAVGGDPTPTGTVTLTSGSYTSATATLSGGVATINIPAGALATDSDTLTVTYTPDTASSSTYTSGKGTNSVTVTLPSAYALTVNSEAPLSGVSINVSPADNNNATNGTTGFTRTYYAGTSVTLIAPSSSGSYSFVSWTGCTSNPIANICDVEVNGNTAVTANYNQPTVTSITVTPATAIIGTQVQFVATVNGTGSYSSGVTWSTICPSCGNLSPGTFTSSGLYTTPYPAPASVTVTATSTMAGFTNVSGSVTVTLSPPATAAGPALTVDVADVLHPISPYIYGMVDWQNGLTSQIETQTNLPIELWNGDQATRYNYQLDAYNNAADWYFENMAGTTAGYPAVSMFNTQVEMDQSTGTRTVTTVPTIGWTTLRSTACSFSVAKYGGQEAADPYRSDCGNGILLNGNPVHNDPADTSKPIDATFDAGWVQYLVGKFGSAANGGVAIYELDNEPEWWDSTQVDVHPLPNSYDELTNDGLTYAAAVKEADPTAQVSGPTISSWIAYFYSKLDMETGWTTGPCYCANGNPVDRLAHGNTPLMEYYLQQFAAYDAANHVRLLDYLDLHTFFAADNLAFSLSGDTGVQQARLNSTRVFWDPTYTDPNFTDPNVASDSPPLLPPQVIRLATQWIAKDYPGTKLALTSYNWGGLEAINGALAQADILGIFGREGVDLGGIWWNALGPETQTPGLLAFTVYRNYDEKNSTFGDMALAACSGTDPSSCDASGTDPASQNLLAIYAASRSSDNALTVIVINKTYGPLTSTLSLENFTSLNAAAQVFQLSNSNLNAIMQQPAATVTPPPKGGSTNTISYTYPAQSITLLIIPD